MSVRCMSAVFERYPGAAGEFLLALALADHAHDDGSHIFPGVADMARKSRQSERAVQLHLRKMLASGWLIKERMGRGRGQHTEYRINPGWLKGADISPFISPMVPPVDNSVKGADISPFTAEKGCNPTYEKGEIHDTKGCNPRHPYITVLTVIEPSPLPPAKAGGADTVVENSAGHGDFAGFIAAYPRKVGKVQAQQVWEKLAPDEALRKRIAEAVRAWARSPEWARNQGQFIPKPARWLREARWDDEPGTTLTPSVAAPPPRMVEAAPLTPEQLKANGERARAAVAMAREVFRRSPADRSRQVPEGVTA